MAPWRITPGGSEVRSGVRQKLSEPLVVLAPRRREARSPDAAPLPQVEALFHHRLADRYHVCEPCQ